MRRTILILTMIIATLTLQAVEIGGEVKNSIKISDWNKSTNESNAKIEFKMKGEGFYSQVTIKGSYVTQGAVEVDRAYTEIYKDKFTAGIGRQRISWGTGYLFNYADAFNEPDPKDPKGEKRGVDSLKVRYDFNETAKIEGAAVQNIKEKNDFAIRGTTTLGKFEIMADYIKVTPTKLNVIKGGEITNEYIILETRGEYEAGLWGALVYKKNSVKNIPPLLKNKFKENEKIGVVGADYTFSFGEESESTLYIVGEYSHNTTTEDKMGYFQTKYTVFKDLDITEGILSDTENGGIMSMAAVNYTLNDFITATVGYNRYINTEKSEYLSIAGNGIGSELYMTIKSNF